LPTEAVYLSHYVMVARLVFSFGRGNLWSDDLAPNRSEGRDLQSRLLKPAGIGGAGGGILANNIGFGNGAAEWFCAAVTASWS